MNNFKIGDKVKVVGKTDGCSSNRCGNCPQFKGKELIIMDFEGGFDTYGRTVGARTLDDKSRCHFNPKDLELVKETNWRKRIEDA